MVSETQRGLWNWKVCVMLLVYSAKSAVREIYRCVSDWCSSWHGSLWVLLLGSRLLGESGSIADVLDTCACAAQVSSPSSHWNTLAQDTPTPLSIFYRNKSILILKPTAISDNLKQNLSLYHSSANLKIYINLFMRWLLANYASG